MQRSFWQSSGLLGQFDVRCFSGSEDHFGKLAGHQFDTAKGFNRGSFFFRSRASTTGQFVHQLARQANRGAVFDVETIEALREWQDFGTLVEEQLTCFGDHLLEKLDGVMIESFGNGLFGDLDSLLFELFDDGVEGSFFVMHPSEDGRQAMSWR